jgi:hypothetical protein
MPFNAQKLEPWHLLALAAGAYLVYQYAETEKEDRAEADFDTVFAGNGPVHVTDKHADGSPKPRYSTEQKQYAARLVTRLYAAFHPYSVWSGVDGTDEEEIEKIAVSAKVNKIGFDILSLYFKAKYKADLLTTMQDELSTDQWSAFVSELP